jgi:hypothetical protein
MNLVSRRGLAFQNLEGLRRAVYGLPGADSVLLNRTGDSYFLIGFKQSEGKRKPISVEIPQQWLENAGMLEHVEMAALRFGSLMTNDIGAMKNRRGPVGDSSDAPPLFSRLPH